MGLLPLCETMAVAFPFASGISVAINDALSQSAKEIVGKCPAAANRVMRGKRVSIAASIRITRPAALPFGKAISISSPSARS